MISQAGIIFRWVFPCVEDKPKRSRASSYSSCPSTMLSLFIFTIATVSLAESEISPTSSPPLQLCVKNHPEIPQEDFLELPTFSAKTFNYTLEKHAVDRSSDFFACKNGEMPIAIKDSAVISKGDFDEEYYASDHHNRKRFLFGALGSATFLFDNYYLSVGIKGMKTTYYYSPTEYCIENVHGTGINITSVFKICPFAKERPILTKCCPIGMVLAQGACIPAPQGEKWDPQYLDAKTKQIVSLEKANPVYSSSKPVECGEDLELLPANSCSNEFHPVTDSGMAYIGSRRTWQFFPVNAPMCIDLQLTTESQRTVLIHCRGTKIQNDQKFRTEISFLYMTNFYIGAFFHFLTTTVYLITWRKQNNHGRTLTSVTASLCFMQIFLGNVHLIGKYKHLQSKGGCMANSIAAHYFFIAAFTWLLVLNVDLWRTFGSIRASSNNNGLKRFIKYSICGWGFPLVIIIISLCLEFTFTCPASGVPVPEYGKHYCFVAPWAQGYYVYYILAVLLALIVLFAILTLYGLYSLRKGTGNLRSNKSAKDVQIFLLFLKLIVLCGFTWIFEFISWMTTDGKNDGRIGIIWIVLDFYNSLSAILIFIIFVCKKTTLNLLEQSCPVFKGLTTAVGKFISISEAGTGSTVAGTSIEY